MTISPKNDENYRMMMCLNKANKKVVFAFFIFNILFLIVHLLNLSWYEKELGWPCVGLYRDKSNFIIFYDGLLVNFVIFNLVPIVYLIFVKFKIKFHFTHLVIFLIIIFLFIILNLRQHIKILSTEEDGSVFFIYLGQYGWPFVAFYYENRGIIHAGFIPFGLLANLLIATLFLFIPVLYFNYRINRRLMSPKNKVVSNFDELRGGEAKSDCHPNSPCSVKEDHRNKSKLPLTSEDGPNL